MRNSSAFGLPKSPFRAPKVTVYLASATHFPDPACVKMWIKAVGGGGGSGNSSTSTASDATVGGNTTFGSLLTALGGVPGNWGANGANTANAVNTVSDPAQAISNVPGQTGLTAGGSPGTSLYTQGGNGGSNPFGSGGPSGVNVAGVAAIANSGGGGGGAGSSSAAASFGGNGGNSGGYVEAIVSAPDILGSYIVTIGAGGLGSTVTAGSGYVGAAGGSGRLVVIEEF